jgi:hypothetical protein
LRQCLTAADLTLADSDWEQLDEVSAIDLGYPNVSFARHEVPGLLTGGLSESSGLPLPSD